MGKLLMCFRDKRIPIHFTCSVNKSFIFFPVPKKKGAAEEENNKYQSSSSCLEYSKQNHKGNVLVGIVGLLKKDPVKAQLKRFFFSLQRHHTEVLNSMYPKSPEQ